MLSTGHNSPYPTTTSSSCKLHKHLTTCKACNNESTTKLSEFTVGCLVLQVCFENHKLFHKPRVNQYLCFPNHIHNQWGLPYVNH
ncbi:hypothetical protein HanRHA438_Chr08g0370961 [Helianthus annuus]|nr:hypothetical protein HanRHA438_Chr08g0370961 [Helianthus annuus]